MCRCDETSGTDCQKFHSHRFVLIRGLIRLIHFCILSRIQILHNAAMPATATAESSISLTPNTTAATQGRITSIDALRGFDMFWIIGADVLVQALNRLAKGNP